jgi:hypothetical protein
MSSSDLIDLRNRPMRFRFLVYLTSRIANALIDDFNHFLAKDFI